MSDLARLLQTHRAAGRVDWIGVRPVRLAEVETVDSIDLTESGLDGDHGRPGKRALTLIQAEHFPVIAALAGLPEVTPETLRRNLVISGINLRALRQNRLKIGTCEVEITVPCAPCSRMEKSLGTGGYNAMRGHGGWCAQVITPGHISVGEKVEPVVA